MDLEQAKVKFAHPGLEAAILACVFKDPTNYFEVEAKLSEPDFLTPHHRAIWTIVRTLVREGVAGLDTAAILTQAASLKLDTQIGGYDYVSALFDKNIDPANIDFYIQRVVDASTKLKILQAGHDIIELTELNKTLTGETLNAETIVEHAQQKFLQISMDTQKSADAVDIAEGVVELLEEVTSKPTDVRGIETGFSRLDTAINGLEPGTLTVLGARPKTGKSAILLNWAKHIAYHSKVPVLVIDTEMSTREQRFRLLSILSGIPERMIKNGTYTQFPDYLQAMDEAIRIIQSGLILHKYYPDFTPEGVAALTRKYRHQYGVGCLVFDYIKLPDADLQMIGNVKEHQALGFLCVALKNLAGQLQIPVITAAQIGRGGANKGHVASSDFADSDRILRYANTLLGASAKSKDEFKKLEEEYGREVARNMGTHRLQILDARAGGTNFTGIDLYFRKETLTVVEAQQQLTDLLKNDGGIEDA
jgi:replicative DNA helicase